MEKDSTIIRKRAREEEQVEPVSELAQGAFGVFRLTTLLIASIVLYLTHTCAFFFGFLFILLNSRSNAGSSGF